MTEGQIRIERFLNLEGQIVHVLKDGAAKAGDVYRLANFSQPVVSEKLARLQDQGVILSYRDQSDRRVVWYQLTEVFEKSLRLAAQQSAVEEAKRR